MGFLSGRVTFERYQVVGPAINQVSDTELDMLASHAMGKVGAVSADGVEVGFTAGQHLLDLDFQLDKNIINDALHFALRVDTNKVPNDLLKAYTQMELAALAKDNPSGFPTKQQRVEAREMAEQQCEEEAKTGKFRKMRQFSVLWDTREGVLYIGTSSASAIERLMPLFKQAFDRTLSRVTAGSLAHEHAIKMGRARSLEDAQPANFHGPSSRQAQVAWVASEYGSRDFLGNEFLLWLWWVLETHGDSIVLSDETKAVLFMNKTLSLECPLSETGKETISSEAPTQLPEAKRAISSGKLPRKAGLMVARNDIPFEFTLQAETLAVGSASLPKYEGPPGRAEWEERIDHLRYLSQTVDLLFESFCRRRLDEKWKDELAKLRLWLEKD